MMRYNPTLNDHFIRLFQLKETRKMAAAENRLTGSNRLVALASLENEIINLNRTIDALLPMTKAMIQS